MRWWWGIGRATDYQPGHPRSCLSAVAVAAAVL